MKELLQQALDALEDAVGLHVRWDDAHAETITALREALAAPMPEPGAWQFDIDESNLYHGDALVASFDNTECTNDSWREACRYGVEIAARMNATPQQAEPAVPDPWRMAVDAAMVGHALDCTTPDSDPKQCVELLCKQVADIWRDIAAPAVPDGVPDTSLVICPNCCTQFRAIPQDVQRLMIDAGFEPPFVAAPVVREPVIDEMDAIASQYAHKLALDLECVLNDYHGKWWDTAMQTIGEYRMAMNRIHERESPTHMGEPVLSKHGITGGGK